MNRFEKKLLVSLLRRAIPIEEHELPNTDEAWEMYLAIHDWAGTGDGIHRERPSAPTFCIERWLLLDFFADKLEES